MPLNKNKEEYVNFGHVPTDPKVSDLVVREEKRTDIALGHVDEHLSFSDGRKTTVVILFSDTGEFIGAGTAIKSPVDKFNEDAGLRKATARALRSITVHEKRPNGKRVRHNAR